MGEKTGLNKGAWTSEEDERLSAYMNTGEFSTWGKLPKSAGLNRCGKSCRLRWTNYLRPDLKRGAFTREEEELILNMHYKLGTSWSKMAARLPGRSDNEIKNYWHTRLKNKSTKRTKPKKAKRVPKPSRQDSVPNPFHILESSSIVGTVSLPKSQGSSAVVGNEAAIMEDHRPHEMYSEADAIPWPALAEIMLKLYDENEISSKPDSECELKDYIRSVWDFPVSPQTSDGFSPPNIDYFFMENLTTDEIVMLSEPIQKLDRNDQFKIDEEVAIMEYLATGETAISSEMNLEPDRFHWNDQLMIEEEVSVAESMDTNQMATPSEPKLEFDPDYWHQFSLLYQSLGFTSDMV